MKFVKENLVLVICAAVVVLFPIAALVYPLGSWLSAEQHKAGTEFSGRQGTIQQIINYSIEIPGTTTRKGVPSDNLYNAKSEAITNITNQSAQVMQAGEQNNRKGRVNIKGGVYTPLLESKPEAHFLPEMTNGAVPMAFKEEYGTVFDTWTQKLVGSATPGTPPKAEELKAQYDEMKNRLAASKPPGLALAAANDTREMLDFQRSKIMLRATALQMYVEPAAFQRRAFIYSEAAPDEQNIFEALVDCWFQGDVVRAIAATNKSVLDARDAKDKNVGSSPVHRLMRITVGNDATRSLLGTFGGGGSASGGVSPQAPLAGGNLFFQGGAAITPTGTDVPTQGSSAAQPNIPDETRSLTGRASGTDYDIVFIQINVDIDPAYLNKFVDELYRQNMGYTVLNIRTKTIDPLERATNGYIYGEKQAVEAEIMVEGLLFRSWTGPLMPAGVRASLGLPALVPAAPGQQPG